MDNVDKLLILQGALDILYAWSKKWRGSIATEKCIQLNVGRRIPCVSYSINSSSVSNVEDMVDLGVTVDQSMRFEKDVANVVSEAWQCAALYCALYCTL